MGCNFCNLSSTTKGETLNDSTFKSLVDYLSRIGTKVLFITGGEIFDKGSRFLDVMPYLNYKFDEVVLQTNGVDLTKEKFVKLESLSNLSCVEISFHERIDLNLLKKLEGNIQDAVSYGLPIEINYLVDSTNQNILIDLLHRHISFGVNDFHFFRLGPEGFGKSQKTIIPSYSNWFNFISRLYCFQEDHPLTHIYVEPNMIDLPTFERLKLHNFGACVDEKKIIISADGTITNCFFLKSGQTRSLKRDNLVDIVKQAKHIDPETVDSNCPSCETYSICKGGCKVYVNTYHDQKFREVGIIPICPIAQAPVSELVSLINFGVIAKDPLEIYSQM